MIWVLLLLSLLLLLILMMPARRRDNIVMQNHSEENLRLYQERSDEVKNSDLDDEQKAALQLELDREFLANAGDEHQAGSAQREPKRWPLALAMVAVVLA
ncbi:MAG: c-type cytochrome biogenesis protein CcmI, partial [Oceanospirillaceae bacterium]|nr:c-type cytochrome biogenesis protein CcmI [Oceanospirillaceae bacterium]